MTWQGVKKQVWSLWGFGQESRRDNAKIIFPLFYMINSLDFRWNKNKHKETELLSMYIIWNTKYTYYHRKTNLGLVIEGRDGWWIDRQIDR